MVYPLVAQGTIPGYSNLQVVLVVVALLAAFLFIVAGL